MMDVTNAILNPNNASLINPIVKTLITPPGCGRKPGGDKWKSSASDMYVGMVA